MDEGGTLARYEEKSGDSSMTQTLAPMTLRILGSSASSVTIDSNRRPALRHGRRSKALI